MGSIDFAGIRFQIETILAEDVSAYFVCVTGDLLCYCDDAEDRPQIAGKIEFYLIHAGGAQAHGHATEDLFDQMQESYECYDLLFDPETGDFRESFTAAFEEPTGWDILMFHRLEVLPAFRGYRLGLAAIDRAIEIFGQGCGYAVLKAVPLQVEPLYSPEKARWHEEMQLATFPEDEAVACTRLQAHYARLGFRSIFGTDWMASNLAYQRPDLVEIGFSL